MFLQNDKHIYNFVEFLFLDMIFTILTFIEERESVRLSCRRRHSINIIDLTAVCMTLIYFNADDHQWSDIYNIIMF